MDELAAWLRVQIDDDERVARAWLPFGNPTDADRDHIARHDPARVLAEVDAKRRILDFAGSSFALSAQDPDSYTMRGSAAAYSVVIKLLALPYAGREGYRSEWRP